MANVLRKREAGVKPRAPDGDRQRPQGAKAPSFFSKLLQILACFLQIFANISLAVLSVFKDLSGEKSFLAP
jgi:hypothetical protein